MTEISSSWLTMQEAAQWAACSRKTLYRYMSRGVVKYQISSNGRRYLEFDSLRLAFEHQKKRFSEATDISDLNSRIEQLHNDISELHQSVERMIELYHPNSIAELNRKQFYSK